MSNWALIAAIIVMIISIAGTVLPILPGLPVAFLTALLYSWYTNFTDPNLVQLFSLLILTIIGTLLDYFSGVIGAKKYGATRAGTLGTFIGGILGLVLIPMPLGLIIGPLIGAIAGEMLSGKNLKEASTVAWGTMLGILGGGIAKLIIGLIMLGLFIYFVV